MYLLERASAVIHILGQHANFVNVLVLLQFMTGACGQEIVQLQNALSHPVHQERGKTSCVQAMAFAHMRQACALVQMGGMVLTSIVVNVLSRMVGYAIYRGHVL
jgi:hypothetical protein